MSSCLILVVLVFLLAFRSSLFIVPHRVSFSCSSPSWIILLFFTQHLLALLFLEIQFGSLSSSYCYSIFLFLIISPTFHLLLKSQYSHFLIGYIIITISETFECLVLMFVFSADSYSWRYFFLIFFSTAVPY